MDGARALRRILLLTLVACAMGASPAMAAGLGSQPARVAAPAMADGTRALAEHVSVAQDAARGQQIVAWVQIYRVYVARVGADGSPIGAPVALGMDGAWKVDVAWDATRDEGVVIASGNGKTYAQVLSGSGLAKVRSAVRLEVPRTGWNQTDPRATRAAGGWLLVWAEYGGGYELKSRTLADDGTPGALRTIATPSSPLGWTIGDGGPGRRVLAWTARDTAAGDERRVLRAQRLADDGTLQGTPRRLTEQAPGGEDQVGVASFALGWDGERWLAAWDQYAPEERFWSELKVLRLDGDLTPIGTPTSIGGRDNYHYYGGSLRMAVQPARDEALLVWDAGHSTERQVEARAVSTATATALDSERALVSRPEAPKYPTALGHGAFDLAPTSDGAYTLLWRIGEDFEAKPADQPYGTSGIYGRGLAVGRAPETVLTAAPSEGAKGTPATITFAATPPAGTPASAVSLSCWDYVPETWDPAPYHSWYPCTSPQTRAQKSRHYYGFGVRATTAGWTDATPAFRHWVTGDFTAEPATIRWHVPKLTTARVARFAFEAYDEPTVTFSCSFDGGARFPCGTMNQGSSELIELVDVPLGDHELRVWTRDGFGNVQETPTVWRWTVFSIEEEGGRTAPAPAPGDVSATPLPGDDAPSTALATPAGPAGVSVVRVPVASVAPKAPASRTAPRTAKGRRVKAAAPRCARTSRAKRCVAARRKAAAARRKAAARRAAKATTKERAR